MSRVSPPGQDANSARARIFRLLFPGCPVGFWMPLYWKPIRRKSFVKALALNGKKRDVNLLMHLNPVGSYWDRAGSGGHRCARVTVQVEMRCNEQRELSFTVFSPQTMGGRLLLCPKWVKELRDLLNGNKRAFLSRGLDAPDTWSKAALSRL